VEHGKLPWAFQRLPDGGNVGSWGYVEADGKLGKGLFRDGQVKFLFEPPSCYPEGKSSADGCFSFAAFLPTLSLFE